MRAPQTKALGRMTGHICKCGATIICRTRTRPCAKKHVFDSDAEGKGMHKSDGLCVVCMNVPPEAVFVPCGHLVACMDCVSKITQALSERKEKKRKRPPAPLCLICRAIVKQVVKVFTV